MRTQLVRSGCSFVTVAFLGGFAACSSKTSSSPTDAAKDVGQQDADSGADAGCKVSTPDQKYVLIDDMEMGTNGPIGLDGGFNPPLMSGYWYNSGASYRADGGAGTDDTSSPAQGSFAFTSLPTATTTLNCKPSSHAARQQCALSGLYDTCGVGFEFAQQLEPDAGTSTNPDAGQPRVTVPFDISRYKAVTFWVMTTTPDPKTDSLHVKIQFPDTDTDPRGQQCNGGSADNSSCYNSYAAYFEFTTSWKQFTVLLDAGADGGVAPDNGISIDSTWGYQGAQWIPTKVYGMNWQAQRNDAPDAGPPLMTDIWVDDVYFVE